MKRTSRIVRIACRLIAISAFGQLAGPAAQAAADSGGSGQPGTGKLHWIAYQGDEAHIRRIVEGGADINARLDNGNTALHIASYKGHIDVARYLIGQGAQVNAVNNEGLTPLDWAQRNGHRELAELLIANGAQAGATAATESAGPQSEKPDNARVTLRTKPSGAPGREQPEGYGVQLGSFGSEQAALDAWALIRRKHPGILDGHRFIGHSVNLAGKQYFRVRVEVGSEREARVLCERLRARDQPCLVVFPQAP